jgi:hypothetical protein
MEFEGYSSWLQFRCAFELVIELELLPRNIFQVLGTFENYYFLNRQMDRAIELNKVYSLEM